MGAFFKPSEEPGVKRAKRSGATLIPGSSDGTLCAAIAEHMSDVARSLRRKTLSLSPPCGVGPFQVAEMGQKEVGLDNQRQRDSKAGTSTSSGIRSSKYFKAATKAVRSSLSSM